MAKNIVAHQHEVCNTKHPRDLSNEERMAYIARIFEQPVEKAFEFLSKFDNANFIPETPLMFTNDAESFLDMSENNFAGLVQKSGIQKKYFSIFDVLRDREIAGYKLSDAVHFVEEDPWIYSICKHIENKCQKVSIGKTVRKGLVFDARDILAIIMAAKRTRRFYALQSELLELYKEEPNEVSEPEMIQESEEQVFEGTVVITAELFRMMVKSAAREAVQELVTAHHG